jgi:hypothetical protein
MSFYQAGRSAVGVGRGVARSLYNRGVRRLGHAGHAGRVLRAETRARQLTGKRDKPGLEDRAVRALGGPDIVHHPRTMHYARRLGKEGRDYGRHNRERIAISERAFTGTLGYVTDMLRLSQPHPMLALRLLLRGNRTLQFAVHEIGHRNQPLGTLGVGLRSPLPPGTSPSSLIASIQRRPPGYYMNPLEFTRPGSPFIGAWNLMLKAPVGPLAAGIGRGSVGLNLLDPKGGR